MVECQVLVGVHQELADFCSRLAAWLHRAADLPPDYSDFNSSSKVRGRWYAMFLDPDPRGPALFLVVRIRILKDKNDPQNKKKQIFYILKCCMFSCGLEASPVA